MIPIYRAKKIDSDTYIEGCFLKEYFNPKKLRRYSNVIFIDNVSFDEIDISTLSIHFCDMLDSQGNKIFASLQEDGKGGDIVDNFNFQEKYRIQIAIYKYNCFHLMDKDGDTYSLIECKLQEGIKVIGIQQ